MTEPLLFASIVYHSKAEQKINRKGTRFLPFPLILGQPLHDSNRHSNQPHTHISLLSKHRTSTFILDKQAARIRNNNLIIHM